MKTVITAAFLILPTIVSAQAYKCTVDGVPKYQSSPCQANPDASPITLKTPSPELLRKMQTQEMIRNLQWEEIKNIEALKQRERERQAVLQDLDHQRQIARARADQSWQDYQQDRFNSECARMASQRIQGDGCPAISRYSSVKLY